MIFVEGELSAISGRAVRRLVMLIVPGGGDLDGVRVVVAGGGGGGECVIWDWGGLSLEGVVDVGVGAGGGKISGEMTVMTSCSMSVRLGLRFWGSESSVDIFPSVC